MVNQRTNRLDTVTRDSNRTGFGIVQRTDVALSRATGNTISKFPLRSPEGISVVALSESNESLAVYGSDQNHQPTLPPIITKPSKPCSPSPSVISKQSPHYFVPEPSDSPKTLNLSPALTEPQINPNPPIIEDLTPPITPLSGDLAINLLSLPKPVSSKSLNSPKPGSPKSLDISLARVFNSLNLKRKAPEETLESSRSKILCLCSPDETPNPINPKPKPSRSTRKMLGGNRGAAGPRTGSSSVGDSNFTEDGLCEVQVQHFYTFLGEREVRARGELGPTAEVDHEMEDPGFGRTVTSQALGDLVRKNRPSIVFLMETKNKKVKLETFRRRLGFSFSFYVDPVGLSGGLALWWTSGLDIDVEGANKKFLHVVVNDKSTNECWASTFVYGCPSRLGRQQVWDCIKNIARSELLPWLCMGDFNQVLTVDDKIGGLEPSQNMLSSFHDMISSCGLVDLEFKGPRFTWRNNRSEDSFIMERIDMAFANSKWREMYAKAMVFMEAAIGSDHNPIMLNTDVPLNKVGKPFRFESYWLSGEECSSVVLEAWSMRQEGPVMLAVCKKLRACKEKLKEWSRKKFGDLRLKIAVTKDRMLDVQKQLEMGFNQQLVSEEKSLARDLEDLWQKDAMYWHQRSRIKWLQMGDKNSRFFHLSTIQWRQRNQIMWLKDKGGNWKSEPKEIAEIIKLHFQDLYEGPPVRDFMDVISLIDPLISPQCNARLMIL
ncbi:hypothetical protein RHSIM_Rhsim02G0152800 [Rhododendron simsii]|uniref:Endonuclease/exonuclease/phosphatase domain-containing protein n=1 Tax=Rhododendron simsii TaxID=118357 RepID=A0A834LX33_RHOSS|nr:hypothetical protein RHSIM_Rhsim02G0152800 [Rhododendron simsii]